jgi:hypothetical protein
MPDGVRTLSSSTFQRPSASRTRSQPDTWHQTPPGGRIPCAWRANAERVTTSCQGTMPSRMISCPW